MALQTSNVLSPLDPNLFTGPARLLAGIGRTGTVVYDTPYTAPNAEYARWLYVGTTGNLAYTKWDGTTELLPNLAAGIWHPIFSIQVNSVNTTIAADQLRWGS